MRILVAHHLLLGDTLMLTPLLAKLRCNFPGAEIVMTTPKAIAPLYQSRPYGVGAVAYEPSDLHGLRALARFPGYDLALVPGDNRHSWLALALGARWIVAFAGDRPAYKNWPVDELRSYRRTPAAWADMTADLVDGTPPPPYDPAQWPAPSARAFSLPASAYAVVHVGASTPLKLWTADRWRAIARELTQRGLDVVWSGGGGEKAIVTEIDPGAKYRSYAGQLDLPQLWHLLAGARVLLCPDTGVAHLGRIVGVPTITLFGPGSPLVSGAGDFWRNSPYWAVTSEKVPCRDQQLLFRREVAWLQRCSRSPLQCGAHICMQAIGTDQVTSALDQALARDKLAVTH